MEIDTNEMDHSTGDEPKQDSIIEVTDGDRAVAKELLLGAWIVKPDDEDVEICAIGVAGNRASSELAASETCARMRALVGAEMPRPLVDELTRLTDAVDILLDEHNYDGTGHEDFRRAQINARRYRHVIRSALAAGEDGDEITPDHELPAGAGG